jgi:uncharacterized protein CbrC (UPF0167 family)
MPPLPIFTIFPDPERENVLKRSDESCGVCLQARGVLYIGPVYGGLPGMDDLRNKICPWCIADGSAGARDLVFNDATIYPATDSTPQLTAEDAKLVEQRTPGFVTWQGNHWLMCCGRACIYLGEPKVGDLRGRWAGAVTSMLEDCPVSPEDVDNLIDSIGLSASPAAYIFRCQVCDKLRGYWDCD